MFQVFTLFYLSLVYIFYFTSIFRDTDLTLTRGSNFESLASKAIDYLSDAHTSKINYFAKYNTECLLFLENLKFSGFFVPRKIKDSHGILLRLGEIKKKFSI